MAKNKRENVFVLFCQFDSVVKIKNIYEFYCFTDKMSI